jgi:hypothetical protein
MVQRPAVSRALDCFGHALNKSHIPIVKQYATGLTRNKAVLFASTDLTEIDAAKKGLLASGRNRGIQALTDYQRLVTRQSVLDFFNEEQKKSSFSFETSTQPSFKELGLFENELRRWDTYSTGDLPIDFAHLTNSKPWPIKMANIHARILSHHGEHAPNMIENGKEVTYVKPHQGIDIQCKRGTPVFAIEDSILLYAGLYFENDEAEVQLFSPTSGLTYCYSHLSVRYLLASLPDLNKYADSPSRKPVSIIDFIKMKTYPISVKQGNNISRVGTFERSSRPVKIPDSVFKVFGNRTDHLHLSISTSSLDPRQFESSTDHALNDRTRMEINPLLVLKLPIE